MPILLCNLDPPPSPSQQFDRVAREHLKPAPNPNARTPVCEARPRQTHRDSVLPEAAPHASLPPALLTRSTAKIGGAPNGVELHPVLADEVVAAVTAAALL
jgi:hypothetical protein